MAVAALSLERLMPYITSPQWAKQELYALRALLYIAAIVIGVGAVFLTPQSVRDQTPEVIMSMWGIMAMAGSLGCLYGALTSRYRWELTSLPLLIGAVSIYAAVLWAGMSHTPTQLTAAGSLTALALSFLIRYVELLVVRWKLRKQHEATER